VMLTSTVQDVMRAFPLRCFRDLRSYGVPGPSRVVFMVRKPLVHQNLNFDTESSQRLRLCVLHYVRSGGAHVGYIIESSHVTTCVENHVSLVRKQHIQDTEFSSVESCFRNADMLGFEAPNVAMLFVDAMARHIDISR
jgi:hypothetical protein